MATGDLVNNIRKMKSKLKLIKYGEDVEVSGITEGLPTVYLPIYHYAFTNYSAPLAELILSKDIQLYGKSDAKFMDAIYKVLRDVFAYKPPVTKDQFFAKGFAERKVIMCTEILDLVKCKNSKLNPGPSKTAMKTSVRPRSAEPNYNGLAVPKTKRPETGKISPRNQDRRTCGVAQHSQKLPRQPPQVVNELISAPSSQPVRHVSHAPSSQPVRHVSHASSQVVPIRHVVGHPEPVIVSDSSDTDSTPEKPRLNYNYFNTPSIKKVCMKSAEVVVMPRLPAEDTLERTLEPSIVEIQAPTSDSVLHGPVASANTEVVQQVSNLYQTVQTLTDLVYNLNSQLNDAKSVTTQSGAHVKAGTNVEKKLEDIQSQISNLAARMVLMENRVSIIEAKASQVNGGTSSVPHAPHTSYPHQTSSHTSWSTNSQQSHSLSSMGDTLTSSFNERGAVSTDRKPAATRTPVTVISKNDRSTELPKPGPQMFTGPGSSFVEELKSMSTNQKVYSDLEKSDDLSLNYSPIRRVVNGVAGQLMSANEDTFALETDDDARRSSTPTHCESLIGNSSLHCNFSDIDTQNQALRINQMLKETMKMASVPTDNNSSS